MEGRSDDQSMQIMLEQMAPRRIAFVHGNLDCAQQLGDRIDTKDQQRYMTRASETIEMKSDTKTYSIKMDDALLHSLQMKKVSDYEIARFSGVMRYPEEVTKDEEVDGEEENAKKKKKEEEKRMLLYPNTSLKEEEGKHIKIINGLDSNASTGDDDDEGMWMGVGELQLSDVRTKLQQIFIRADFQQGGLLVCEGDVTILKDGPNHFALEGVVGDRYYKIREVLYQLLTYVP
jgi:hypothetical protein